MSNSAFTILLFLFIHVSNIYPQDISLNSSSDSTVTSSFVVVGDLMCHTTQYKFAQIEKDSFDFNPVFGKVKAIIESADFAIGNFETTTAGTKKAYSGYPAFNTPDEFVEAIAFAGFDLMVTANNHSLDTGKDGAKRTAEVIERNGMDYNGTFFSKEDSDSIRTYNVNGLEVVIVSYTYDTNAHYGKGKDFSIISYIDTLKIKNDLLKAKQIKPDLIIVAYHFGSEYQKEPSKYQKDLVNLTIENGADIIVASHPHVVQPIEYFETVGGRIDTGFVAYSLGNFISNQRWRYSDCGVILNFSITKVVESERVSLSSLEIIPTWVFKGYNGLKNEYTILPTQSVSSDSTLTYLSKDDLLKIEQSQKDTFEIMTKYSPKLRKKYLPEKSK